MNTIEKLTELLGVPVAPEDVVICGNAAAASAVLHECEPEEGSKTQYFRSTGFLCLTCGETWVRHEFSSGDIISGNRCFC